MNKGKLIRNLTTGMSLMVGLLLTSCDTSTKHVAQRINLDFDWRFYLGDFDNQEIPHLKELDFDQIDVPHDWSIAGEPEMNNKSGMSGGYYPGGIGWYEKDLEWSDDWQNQLVSLTFDGVYMNSDVWVNGHHLGHRPNGYIGFTYDLTPFLNRGSNTILVKVDNSKLPSGRWYTGAGIYRHVWLDVKNNIHIPISGTYVSFTDVDSSKAMMSIQTEVTNESEYSKSLILEAKLVKQDGSIVHEFYKDFEIESGELRTIEMAGEVLSPELWSPQNPYRYKVITTVRDGNEVLNVATTQVGVRSLAFDSKTGFWLNGQREKIKGVCLHQDAGSLGVAVPEDVWVRRIQLLKDMGCNAIRTSHNPFAPEFYTLCDSMGMMVMDEPFDGWDIKKEAYDYGIYFEDWWEQDLADFIKRDRNHPSVIMWSIGNEVRGRSDSVEHLLYQTIKQLDQNRAVTIGAGHDANIVDIAGFNGVGEFPDTLETVHQLHPDWPIVGTEVPHSWQTRGVYRTKTWWRGRDFPAPWEPQTMGKEPKEGLYVPIPDLTEEELFTDYDSNYLSSYDNATVRISARDQWKKTSQFDWFMGEFRWTGFDYLGENIWPNRGWHCGVLDLAGFKKDHYYFYQSVWTEKPMVHILPHWTHPGKVGKEIPVVVYSNCEEIELFLNDKSLGIKRDTANDLRLLWYVPYEAGTIEAVAKTKQGDIISTYHTTAKEPHSIQLSADKTVLSSDNRSVAHLTVKVVDEFGNFVPDANVAFTYEVKGPAKVLAVENGDMMDLTSGMAASKKTFNGLALMYLKSTLINGEVEVVVHSNGLEDGVVKLRLTK